VRTIRLQQKVLAPVDRLWAACATPKGIANWQADAVSGKVVKGHTLTLGWPELGVHIDLEVREVEQRRHLAFEHASARLEFEISPGEITLSHHAPFDNDEAEGTESSWRVALGTLAHYLACHDGRERHVFWAVRSAMTTSESAHAFFTLPETLASWLGRTEEPIGPAGTRYRLEPLWGGSMTGTVLAHMEGRDLALSFEEAENSVIGLRTLPSPRASGERLLLAFWSRWVESDATSHIETGLDTALGRLARMLGKTGRA
jgi:uncharacterized protein YndB with AHSA1/START domain